MGTHDFKYNNVPLFAKKPGNINTSMSAAPKLALVPVSRYVGHPISSDNGLISQKLL